MYIGQDATLSILNIEASTQICLRSGVALAEATRILIKRGILERLGQLERFAKFGVAGLCAVRLAIDRFELKECENFLAHAGYDP